jgi:lysozyme
METKLGFHCNRSGDDVLEAIAKVKPQLLKFLDPDPGFVREARAASPGSFLLGRCVLSLKDQLFREDPIKSAQSFAKHVLHNGAGVDAWESYNEAFGETEPPNYMRAYDHFQVEFLSIMLDNGLEAVAGNFGTGNMLGKHWLNNFQETLQSYTYLGFHEYDWPDMWSMHRQNIEEKGEEGMWLTLRYRRIMREIRKEFGPQHTALITECGMTRGVHGEPDVGPWNEEKPITAQRYWESLKWYDNEICKDNYLLGACLFVVGATTPWETFEHLGIINRFMVNRKLPKDTKMRISIAGQEMICALEGFSANAYWDHQQWSIGYGSGKIDGIPVKVGDTITRKKADETFLDLLVPYEEAVHARLDVNVNQEQFDALVSATYNLGRGGIDSVFILINGGDFQGAAKHLLKYVNASGVEVPALIERRKREAQMIYSEEKDDSAEDPVHMYTSGEPRVNYDRTYWLIPPSATEEEARQVFEMALPNKGTVGFSADDAGIGALPNRRVIIFDEDRWGGDMNQWYAQYYPGVTIENRKLLDPLKKVSPKPIAYVPSGKNEPALVGLHGSADSSWGNPLLPAEQDMIKSAKIEAFKLLSDEHPMSVDILRAINPDMFILLRLFAKFDSHGHDPQSFVNRVLTKAVSFYERGIRYMEVHNEPNLTIEGQGKNWRNGTEFAYWFLEVEQRLREAMPEVLIGFPGLSPGPSFDKRYEGYQFYHEAEAAVNASDWIGCHCYWTHDDDDVAARTGGMRSRDGGEYYKRLDTKGKQLLITEFSNPSAQVSKAEKAQQYTRYYKLLDGVHSAYCFVSSASSGFPHETWNASPIAHIVGQRNNL